MPNKCSYEFENDSSDEASAEGVMMRGIFKSTSSSSLSSSNSFSCTESNNPSIAGTEQNDLSKANEENKNDDILVDKKVNSDTCYPHEKEITTSVYLDDIILSQQSVGGEIAQRLWPAASYLAIYLLEFVDRYSNNPYNIEELKTLPKKDNNKSDFNDKELEKKDAHFGSSTSFNLMENERIRNAREQLEKFVLSHLKNEIYGEQPLTILELGAGVGLTGIKVATKLRSRVILTDLPLALPLLNHNIQQNAHNFVLDKNCVTAEQLAWGDNNDWIYVLNKFKNHSDTITRPRATNTEKPILILASDCVYFQEFHLPLEQTLANILSSNDNDHSKDGPQALSSSICLIAAKRRTKRDTAFFKNLGKKTRTSTHSLECVCIEQSIVRSKGGSEHGYNGCDRNIMRIYSIQWLPRSKK